MNALHLIRLLFLNPFLKFASKSKLLSLEQLAQEAQGKGWGGSTTSQEASEIDRFIKLKNIENVFALDIGANLGNWSFELMKLQPSAKITAFEPSKEAFRLLSSRFVNEPNFEAINIALGKDNKLSILHANSSGSGLASLTKRRLGHLGINFEFTEEIKVKTLDSWLADSVVNIRPNVLKIDVEGHELDVLYGAQSTLNNIQIVQFEFGGCNIDTKTFFQDMWYFFSERNFLLFRITPRGSSLVASYSESDEVFRATNFIAVRK